MDIEAANAIGVFIHCRKCLIELPIGVSPREWAQVEVGWTRPGFQVWCKRHEINVLHIDFEGSKHTVHLRRPAGLEGYFDELTREERYDNGMPKKETL
jgi:hypothetical protein